MKIGNFIQLLDNLITLHQRKYDRLVNVKKALLDKMFPKNGELVPSLRFKGFNDTGNSVSLIAFVQSLQNKLDLIIQLQLKNHF